MKQTGDRTSRKPESLFEVCLFGNIYWPLFIGEAHRLRLQSVRKTHNLPGPIARTADREPKKQQGFLVAQEDARRVRPRCCGQHARNIWLQFDSRSAICAPMSTLQSVRDAVRLAQKLYFYRSSHRFLSRTCMQTMMFCAACRARDLDHVWVHLHAVCCQGTYKPCLLLEHSNGGYSS